jgi:hypothetical protein
MLITQRALAIVAAEVVTLWGITATDHQFMERTVADAIRDLSMLSQHERALLERAVYDNLEGYCKWAHPNINCCMTAFRWSAERPTWLNPLRYNPRRGAAKAGGNQS